MKNMITSLKLQGVLTIFYNVRKSVYRHMRGISIDPTEFHHCSTQQEIYSVIKSHNKLLNRSKSMAESMFTQSNKSNRLWATQSVEAF